MRIAPLQPEALVFEKINIETVLNEDGSPTLAPGFDFQGVNFGCSVEHGELNSTEPNSVDNDDTVLVRIDVQIDNHSGKPAPYAIRIVAVGIFHWLDKKVGAEERIDLIVVNGASMLYASARELVLSLTSRSVPGALLLPSFNFLDSKPSLAKVKTSEAPAQIP